jgi:hypothetical protein
MNFKAVGGAIAGVGGALGALAALFSALGLDEEAETVGIVAGAFVALGSIVSTLGPIFQNVGG